MPTHRSFTPRHQEIFNWLLNVTPENWRAKVLNDLGEGTEGDVLHTSLGSIKEQRAYLIGLTRELPPLHHLPGYFFTAGGDGTGSDGMESVHASVVGASGDELDFLRLPGSNVAETVRGLYRHLETMIAMGEELEEHITSLISSLPLFHDKGNATPYEEIRKLPSIITRDQRLSIAAALESGDGVIDLSNLNKTNAAVVLSNLELAMLTKEISIPKAHKRAIEVKCYQESFLWYGTGKGDKRGRDWVKHYAGASNAFILPELATWAETIL